MNISSALMIATDGSSSNSPRSGWAWVAEDGSYRAGTVASSTILVAELQAIYEAIQTSAPGTRLRILTDSKPALNLIDETLCTGVIRHRPGVRGAKEAALVLHRIAVQTAQRQVRFEWVKGHSGNSMNEAADRLAVQARRCVQLGGDPARLGVIYDRIVSESLVHLARRP